MLQSLQAIEALKTGDNTVLKTERWLMHLALAEEVHVNLERFTSLEELKDHYVLNYVEKTLRILDTLDLHPGTQEIIEAVLKWSEVAKGGLAFQRQKWREKHYNLSVHNIGSAQIYNDEAGSVDSTEKAVIQMLIETHGLIGQAIRGEVALNESMALEQLLESGYFSREGLETLLMALNQCIIGAVDRHLWEKIAPEVEGAVKKVLKGQGQNFLTHKERIRRLRATAIKNGEDFEAEYQRLFAFPEVAFGFESILDQCDLWYVEAALYDFSFEEFVKIFLLVGACVPIDSVRHFSFERFMKRLYYQHHGKKRVNIYKKRIIEKYLSELTIEGIGHGDTQTNPHVQYLIQVYSELDDTAFFNFQFSAASEKLIDFCVEAEKAGMLYESAIVLLFDLFDLRKDQYDRFYEEERYLQTMNQAVDFKKVILDYIVGSRVIDIGPGGGALMDVIERRYPDKQITGVDISQNVLDALKKKKQLENKKWDVLYGDALNLKEYLEPGSVDTIIYCSVLHELYSYIEYNGSKFNHETLAVALKSAFEILSVGGRIIIRDGIMTEPVEQKRIIRFLSNEGLQFLNRYCEDFKGREVRYTMAGHNEVVMAVNDAMEFLYTYTWGERSYIHEINEQFGYFTPSEFKAFIEQHLGEEASIVELKHYLQEGYTTALAPKVVIFDEDRKSAQLPDSTCLVVIEKRKKNAR